MFATLYTPQFHLQAVSPAKTPHPVALLDTSPADAKGRATGPHGADRVSSGTTRPAGNAIRGQSRSGGTALVFQRNPAAERHGIHPGMTASQALARCGSLRLLERDLDAEQAAQTALLDVAAAFTPDFEDTAPGIVTLDLLGHPDLPHDADPLARKLAAAAGRATGFNPLRAGLADNPGLSLLAARLARQTNAKVIRARRNEIRGFLAPLSVDALEPSPELFHVLHLWGIHTIGDFTALPLSETAERLGPEAVELWKAATGGESRLLRLVRPPTGFSHGAELEYEIETLDPLLFLFRRALETIAARLESAWLVASTLTLTLRFTDGKTHHREFHIPDPTGDPELLSRLLHTHLEDFTAPSPIIGYHLEADATKRNGCQFEIFESRLRDPNRFYETLARLEALLGPGRVGTPQLLPTHRPDAFTMTPFSEKGRAWRPDAPSSGGNVTLPPRPASAVTLPLRRFRPPIPINIKTDTETSCPLEILSVSSNDGTGAFAGPDRTIAGRLLDRRGPWLHSGDWWDASTSWAREEWDVTHENGHLYRLAHEPPTDQWLLEGSYT